MGDGLKRAFAAAKATREKPHYTVRLSIDGTHAPKGQAHAGIALKCGPWHPTETQVLALAPLVYRVIPEKFTGRSITAFGRLFREWTKDHTDGGLAFREGLAALLLSEPTS